MLRMLLVINVYRIIIIIMFTESNDNHEVSAGFVSKFFVRTLESSRRRLYFIFKKLFYLVTSDLSKMVLIFAIQASVTDCSHRHHKKSSRRGPANSSFSMIYQSFKALLKLN